jgi:hypothetical protein
LVDTRGIEGNDVSVRICHGGSFGLDLWGASDEIWKFALAGDPWVVGQTVDLEVIEWVRETSWRYSIMKD